MPGAMMGPPEGFLLLGLNCDITFLFHNNIELQEPPPRPEFYIFLVLFS